MREVNHSIGAGEKITIQKAVPGELFLIMAMVLNSLAVSLMIKADFSISAIISVPYVFSCAFPALSLGTWNAVIQCAWLLVTMIAVGKVKPGYLFSFVLAFVFGLLLDTWAGLLHLLSGALIWRCVYFTVGFLIMSIGIACFFLCGTPVLPFDTVPRAFVMEKRLSVRSVRTAFDLINLALSAAVSMIFVGRIIGIGVGTLVSALLMGTVMGKVTGWMQARYLVRPHFRELGRLV